MILGGEPQIFILSAILIALYSILFTKQKGFHNSRIQIITIICIVFFSAGLITFLQLGMTYMDYQASARLGGITYQEASRLSLEMPMLKHLVLPLNFDKNFISASEPFNTFFKGHTAVPWLLTVYPGIIIVPLALFGIIYNYSHKLLFWAATFFITLILAMGPGTPLHFIFYKIMPIFRFPVKFMFLSGFSLLILAAYGLDRLFILLSRTSFNLNKLFILISAILILDLYFANRYLNPVCDSNFFNYYHPSLQQIIDDPEQFRIYSDQDIKTPPNLEHTIMEHHIQWQMLINPNLGLLNNLSNVGGVPALELRYQYLITELLSRPWTEKIRFLRLANVKYIISTQKLEKIPEINGQILKINPILYKINNSLPRAWMVGKLEPVKKGTIDELVYDSFNPAQTALAKGDIINRYDSSFFQMIESINYEKNSHIHIEVTAEEPGILVLSESSYPGWRVYVDGKERECLWLNLLFQGVELEKGKHSIEFIYRPKYFSLFASVSSAALALFVFIWLYFLFFGKKGQQKAIRHQPC